MGKIIFLLLSALLLTCIIEAVPLLFTKNRAVWIRPSLVCNLITNPLLNIILLIAAPMLGSGQMLFALTVLLEVAVFFAETGLCRLFVGADIGRCIRLSAVCNGISFAAGLLIDALI